MAPEYTYKWKESYRGNEGTFTNPRVHGRFNAKDDDQAIKLEEKLRRETIKIYRNVGFKDVSIELKGLTKVVSLI